MVNFSHTKNTHVIGKRSFKQVMSMKVLMQVTSYCFLVRLWAGLSRRMAHTDTGIDESGQSLWGELFILKQVNIFLTLAKNEKAL